MTTALYKFACQYTVHQLFKETARVKQGAVCEAYPGQPSLWKSARWRQCAVHRLPLLDFLVRITAPHCFPTSCAMACLAASFPTYRYTQGNVFGPMFVLVMSFLFRLVQEKHPPSPAPVASPHVHCHVGELIQSHMTRVHPSLVLCQRFVTSICQQSDRQLQDMKSFSMSHGQTLACKPLGKEMDGELWIWTRSLSPSCSIKPCTQRMLSTIETAS